MTEANGDSLEQPDERKVVPTVTASNTTSMEPFQRIEAKGEFEKLVAAFQRALLNAALMEIDKKENGENGNFTDEEKESANLAEAQACADMVAAYAGLEREVADRDATIEQQRLRLQTIDESIQGCAQKVLSIHRELDKARARERELREACRTILEGFDKSVFVRNVMADADPSWAIKLIPYIKALAEMQALSREGGQ